LTGVSGLATAAGATAEAAAAASTVAGAFLLLTGVFLAEAGAFSPALAEGPLALGAVAGFFFFLPIKSF
jgi:hypothetical protein